MDHRIFCDKCENILYVKHINGKKVGVCVNCGNTKKVNADVISDEKEPLVKKRGEGIVKDDVDKFQGFPHKCKKCGYSESEVYDLGSSYSDEANKYLFKCKKCGYVERQADGGGNH